MSEYHNSVYWINGRCYSCGGRPRARGGNSWCTGCEAEGASWGEAEAGSAGAERVTRLAAAYDAGIPLAERRRLAAAPNDDREQG